MMIQGLDIPDILIVVQWKTPDSLCTLMQRFGRGARDKSLAARAILIAEPRVFDDDVEKAAEAAERKRKKTEQDMQVKKRARANSRGEAYIVKEKPKGRAVMVRMQHGGQARQEDMEVAVRDFVNAENREGMCRRHIANHYFGNDLISM